MSNTKIYIQKGWGCFIGELNDNSMHKHYSIQICIAAVKKFYVVDINGKKNLYKASLINFNILHQVQSSAPLLVLHINPVSSIGYSLYRKYKKNTIISLDEEMESISFIFYEYLCQKIKFNDLLAKIIIFFETFNKHYDFKTQFLDDRVYSAIEYLDNNFDRVISVKEIADFCNLSSSRFLHLFKEKTAINFRRYQLWNKLIKSLPYLQNNSIVNTAYKFGFTDSSHYIRTFKESFGLSPKALGLSK